MKKIELNNKRILLIVLGVIVAIIISFNTSVVGMGDLKKVEGLKMLKETPKNIVSQLHTRIISHVVSQLNK